MSEVDDLLTSEFKKLPKKPADDASQADKKRYSELMSAAAAKAFGEAFRLKGLKGTLPHFNQDSRSRRAAVQEIGREDLSHAEEVTEEISTDEN